MHRYRVGVEDLRGLCNLGLRPNTPFASHNILTRGVNRKRNYIWRVRPAQDGWVNEAGNRYLEGQGDLVSRLIDPITHIVTLVILVINLLIKSQ